MATSTYKSFLMTSTDGSDWTKLVDIKSYPDLGGTPDQLDTTNLSNSVFTNIFGVQKLDALTFNCNYELADYKKLKALEGKTQHFAIWFGGSGTGESLNPTGDEGKFKFQGQLSVYAVGKGVNEVREMTVSLAASTEIELDEGA